MGNLAGRPSWCLGPHQSVPSADVCSPQQVATNTKRWEVYKLLCELLLLCFISTVSRDSQAFADKNQVTRYEHVRCWISAACTVICITMNCIPILIREVKVGVHASTVRNACHRYMKAQCVCVCVQRVRGGGVVSCVTRVARG